MLFFNVKQSFSILLQKIPFPMLKVFLHRYSLQNGLFPSLLVKKVYFRNETKRSFSYAFVLSQKTIFSKTAFPFLIFVLLWTIHGRYGKIR